MSTQTRAEAQSFDRIAEMFDRFHTLVRGPMDVWLRDRLPDSGGRALDLGCGSGHHALLFAERYAEVLGVDVSEPMLAIGRARRAHPAITYQHRDLLDVTLDKDGRFDLVFSAHTLHHVPDLPAALDQIRAMVAPGGRAILIDIADDRPAIPRGWLKRQAAKGLVKDLTRHRRPVGEAFELFRLSVRSGWLDHVTTDRFLGPDEFVRVYGGAFPGSEVVPMDQARILVWTAPAA
jgi:ubiquinone/menaquinone biosynthesis C-methylase UbiE